MQLAVVPIPHGISVNGSWIQRVGIRELNGYDEQLLAEMDNYPIPFRTTALLEKVVSFGQVGSNNNAKLVRQLTAGDRIALMLQIRMMTFEDKLSCTLSCPECKESMSMDLSASMFLQPPVQDPKSEYSINLENFSVKVRPVNGADLESLFVNTKDDGANKAEELVRSCTISSDPPFPDNLTDDFINMVSSELQEIDKQADLILDLTCPSCRHSFRTPFNVEDFVFSEIDSRLNQLELEVHWLAFNYHWSEDSILCLPLKKRRRYVDLVNRTLAGESL